MGDPASGAGSASSVGSSSPRRSCRRCQELEAAFREAWADPAFRAELDALLRRLRRPAQPAHRVPIGSARSSGCRCCSSARTSTTPGRTRSTTCSARRCWPSAWARPRLVAETGAGQHGVATATAAALMGMECIVYMGEVDMARQELNVFRMRLLGAEVVPAASRAAAR